MKNMRSLKEFLVDYPHFRIASEKDNSKVLNFYQKNVRTSPNSLRADRSPDFFKLLRDYSNNFYVIIGIDESGEIDFVCSITLSNTADNKQIGFLRDLRFTQNSPALLLNWVKLYSDFMQEFKSISEFQNLERIFSLSYESNETWKNIFKIFEKKNVFYHKIATLIEYHFSSSKNKPDQTLAITSSDLTDEILHFINQELVTSYLGNSSFLLKQAIDQFICRDDSGNIQGLLVLFDSTAARTWKKENVTHVRLEGRALIKHGINQTEKTKMLEMLIHTTLEKYQTDLCLLADDSLLGRNNQLQVYDFYEITNQPTLKVNIHLGLFNIIN